MRHRIKSSKERCGSSADGCASRAPYPRGSLPSWAMLESGRAEKEHTPRQLCPFNSLTGPRKRLTPDAFPLGYGLEEQAGVKGEERSCSQREKAGSQASRHDSKYTVDTVNTVEEQNTHCWLMGIRILWCEPQSVNSTHNIFTPKTLLGKILNQSFPGMIFLIYPGISLNAVACAL